MVERVRAAFWRGFVVALVIEALIGLALFWWMR
jgi:hypothetical protein